MVCAKGMPLRRDAFTRIQSSFHFEQAALPVTRVPHPQAEQGQYKAMNHNRIASASNARSTSTRQFATMQAAQSRGIQRYKEYKSAGIA